MRTFDIALRQHHKKQRQRQKRYDRKVAVQRGLVLCKAELAKTYHDLFNPIQVPYNYKVIDCTHLFQFDIEKITVNAKSRKLDAKWAYEITPAEYTVEVTSEILPAPEMTPRRAQIYAECSKILQEEINKEIIAVLNGSCYSPSDKSSTSKD